MFLVRNLLRILGITTICALFLGPFFKLYFPFPFRVAQFYFLLWIPILLFIKPQFIFQKTTFITIFFFLIIFILIPLAWYDREFGGEILSFYSVFLEIFPVLGSVLLFKYFHVKHDVKGLKWLLATAILSIVITSIFSIRGLIIDPLAVRLAMSGEADNFQIETRGMAIGGYGLFNAVMLMVPVLVYLLSSYRVLSINWILILILIVLAVVPMYLGGLTTTFFFAIILFSYSYFISKITSLAIYLPVLVFLSSILIFNDLTATLIDYVITKLGDIWIVEKLEDAALTVRLMDYNPETSQSYFASERLSRSLDSFYSFLSDPLLGGGRSGSHAYWFDRLAIFGLIGWGLVFYMFYLNYKYHQARLDKVLFRYYQLSFYAFFVFGFLKGNVLSEEVSTVIFFIFPSFLYLIQEQKWKSQAKGSP
jgi:hypothetical protein